jgi:hypothetical protein
MLLADSARIIPNPNISGVNVLTSIQANAIVRLDSSL